MKSYLVLLLSFFVFSAHSLYSQSSPDQKKFIEVTGSAEKTITPDEIELEIVLTEYSKNGVPVGLESIESEFYDALRKNNIDTQALRLNNLESAYWWSSWHNRNKPLKTKTFRLPINSQVNFLKLTNDLNKKWVESINITEKRNKNIQSYRQEVKIAAIRAAKEKATYLLESVDEHLGGLISVEEIPELTGSFFATNNALSNTAIVGSTGNADVENVSAITIRYEIRVKFEIK